MDIIIKMTVCGKCNEFLNVDWGELNQDSNRAGRCDICREFFGAAVGAAYDLTLDLKTYLIAIIRKIQCQYEQEE